MAIKLVDGRTADGDVGGYMNLRTLEWSFKGLGGSFKGLKVADGDAVVMVGVTPFVRETTRARLVANRAAPGTSKGAKGHKEVHAWLCGRLDTDAPTWLADYPHARQITYRPFERGEFFYVDNGAPFTGAARVLFASDRHAYVI